MLALDKTNLKAWTMRANTNKQILNFEEASADCKTAINLAPNDKSLRELYQEIKT